MRTGMAAYGARTHRDRFKYYEVITRRMRRKNTIAPRGPKATHARLDI